MTNGRRVVIVASALLAFGLSAPAWAQTASFTATYTGQGSFATTCNTSFGITGQEPTSGTHPVFLYMVGTTETYNNNGAEARAVSYMASKGFVAASVQYDSGSFGNCSQISGKAKCIFDSTSASSAISKVCARASAACSKGIVVAGFSQGSVMADLAKNFNSNVRAAWGMGDGVSYSFFNLSSCVANGNRALPSSNLRAVDGQGDQFLGGNANAVRSELQSLTGDNCGSSAFNCLQSNGSGWYIVQNSQTVSGTADHCYWRNGGCSASETSTDANWENGSDVWESAACMNWLAGFASQ
jgi:hypothetical protein